MPQINLNHQNPLRRPPPPHQNQDRQSHQGQIVKMRLCNHQVGVEAGLRDELDLEKSIKNPKMKLCRKEKGGKLTFEKLVKLHHHEDADVTSNDRYILKTMRTTHLNRKRDRNAIHHQKDQEIKTLIKRTPLPLLLQMVMIRKKIGMMNPKWMTP